MVSPSPLTCSLPLAQKPITLSPTRSQPFQQENQPQIKLPGQANNAGNNEASKLGDQSMDVADGRQIQEQDNVFIAVGECNAMQTLAQ